MKIFEALAEARGILEQHGIGNSAQDVESLLRHVSGQERSYLIAHGREELEPQRLADFFRFRHRTQPRQTLAIHSRGTGISRDGI